MNNQQIDDYRRLCESLSDRYCRLLLITGDSDDKSAILTQLWGESVKPIRLSKVLSDLIYELSPRQRTMTVSNYFSGLLSNTHIVYLTDIEILFDETLRINPVSILKDAARNGALIVNWPGKIDIKTGLLTYAIPEHNEYYQSKLTEDILFFDESGSNSLNNATHRS